jgi:hypothetical protein
MPVDHINTTIQTINRRMARVRDMEREANSPSVSRFNRRRLRRNIEAVEAEVQCLWNELNAALAREAVEASLAAAAGAHRARI